MLDIYLHSWGYFADQNMTGWHRLLQFQNRSSMAAQSSPKKLRQTDVVWILALKNIPFVFSEYPIASTISQYSFILPRRVGWITKKGFGHTCLSHKHRWLVVSHVSTSKITIFPANFPNGFIVIFGFATCFTISLSHPT